MSKINVLIVVDALGATTTGNGGLQNNVYLIDTNKHDGSGSEGQAELYTACVSTSQTGDTIAWSIAPVDPGSDVEIAGFTGQMWDSGDLRPQKYPDNSWQGTLSKGLPTGHIQYSVTINIDGKPYYFDPYLAVTSEP